MLDTVSLTLSFRKPGASKWTMVFYNVQVTAHSETIYYQTVIDVHNQIKHSM